MNILLMPARYYPLKGGLETVTNQLSIQLLKKGHKIKIVTSRFPYYLKKEEFIDGVEVERLPFHLFGFQYYWTTDNVLKRLFEYFYAFLRLALVVIKFRPRIVNVHYVSTQSIYATLLSYFFNFKLIVSIHGLGLQSLPRRPAYIHWIYRWVLRRAGYITSCSQALLNDAKERVGGIENKSVVIHNCVNAGNFTCQNPFIHERPYILTIGNFHAYKGIDLLIMAFARFYEERNVDLFIAGEGAKRKKLEELMQALGVEERVHFFGTADDDEKIALLNGCEFFVLPSRIEPFGIVILEAMAAQKAVIAADVDGIPEIIKDGVNGLLVEPKNDKALASAIVRLLEDRQLRDTLASNGRRTVEEQFPLDKQTNAFLEVYEKLCAVKS